jgi:Zn-dependent peptidase ImmA (M78 family)
MTSWQMAHRIAQIAAVQAQHHLQVCPDRFPVLVAPAIYAAGIELMWQPLDRLFGMYLHVGDSQGILVNADRPRATRRQTAAHELAHHWFRHSPHPGIPCAIDAASSDLPQQTVWTPNERVAEAFADWFLMPRKAVFAAIAHLGLTGPAEPVDVYQISLLLGTSYRATVRHLYSLRLITREKWRTWSTVAPGVLKRRLLTDVLPSTREVDVWSITVEPAAGEQPIRYLSPGDQVVLPRELLIDSGGLVREDDGRGRAVLTAFTPGADYLQLAGTAGPVTLPLVVEPRPHGVYIPGVSGARDAMPEVSA